MNTQRRFFTATLGLVLLLAFPLLTGTAQNAPTAAPPTATGNTDAPPPAARMNPDNLIYTFFPVSLLQSFVGISDDQAAQITAIEAKLAVDRPATPDELEKNRLTQQAGVAVKAVLRPEQIETLADYALELQILTNTYTRKTLDKLKFTPAQMPRIKAIMAVAVAKHAQIDQERDQQVNVLASQADPQTEVNALSLITQAREQKILAMRATVKTAIDALLTDAQRAALNAPAAPVPAVR